MNEDGTEEYIDLTKAEYEAEIEEAKKQREEAKKQREEEKKQREAEEEMYKNSGNMQPRILRPVLEVSVCPTRYRWPVRESIPLTCPLDAPSVTKLAAADLEDIPDFADEEPKKKTGEKRRKKK